MPLTLEKTLPYLDLLIKAETISHQSNLPLMARLAEHFTTRGFRVVRLPNARGDKENLIATIGPENTAPLAFAGHVDVVPVAGQPWTVPPFVLTRKDKKLFGRGTCDMKGFVAIMLALAEELAVLHQAKPLPRAVQFLFTYDEETTMAGAAQLVTALGKEAPKPAMILVGEPSAMTTITQHKGISAYTFTFTGKEGHSSQPHKGRSAIAMAVQTAQYLLRLAAEKGQRPFAGSAFDPPYTTFNLGQIEGGTAVNIIARHATLTWECRPHPGDNGEGIMQQVQQFLDAQGFTPYTEIKPLIAVPPFADVPDHPLVSLAAVFLASGKRFAAPFATEASLYQSAQIPVLICGPGSIEQAHQPDEFVTEDQFMQGLAFAEKLAAAWVSGTNPLY